MIFRQLYDAPTSTYTYLMADGPGADALILDPVAEKVDVYQELARELDVKLAYAIDTHVHADHVTALGMLRERASTITLMGEQSRAECVSRTFRDGEVITVGDLRIEAMYTPGHTDDSYSFRLGDRVFTGDTLLIRGTGRTDFQNGDPSSEYDSIFHKLLTLPDETRVYPGHDYRGFTVSTIAEERAHNPRLQVASREEFIALMNGLNLPNPKLMDVAVPANLRCGLLPNVTA